MKPKVKPSKQTSVAMKHEANIKKNSLVISGAETDDDLKVAETTEQEKTASQLSAEALEYSVVADKELEAPKPK